MGRFSRGENPGSGELRGLYSLFFVAVVCMLVSGCGYRHVGYAEGRLTSGGKTVGISLFANKSYRSNLEATLTASLVDEFARRSGGKVVAEADAELILSGTIDSYVEVPVSYTASDVIKEYRASMTVKATLRDKASQKVLWKGEISETQTFPSFADTSLVLITVPAPPPSPLPSPIPSPPPSSSSIPVVVSVPSPLLTNIPLRRNIGPLDQSTISLLQDSESAAVREICRKLAQGIYQKISEDF